MDAKKKTIPAMIQRAMIYCGIFFGISPLVHATCDSSLLPTATTRSGLQIPQVNSCSWGATLNQDLSIIDSSACFQSVSNTFSSTQTFSQPILLQGQPMRFYDATSHYIQIQAPNTVTTTTFTWPTSDGSANQVLQTNGTGNLSWSAPGNASSLLSTTNTWTATQAFNSNTSINNELDVSNGAGTSGYFLQSRGSSASPQWASNTLSSGSTNYIQNTSVLQSGATFYVSSGAVSGKMNIHSDSNKILMGYSGLDPVFSINTQNCIGPHCTVMLSSGPIRMSSRGSNGIPDLILDPTVSTFYNPVVVSTFTASSATVSNINISTFTVSSGTVGNLNVSSNLSINGSGAGQAILTEGAQAGVQTPTAGLDVFYADSSSHSVQLSNNGGAFGSVVISTGSPVAGQSAVWSGQGTLIAGNAVSLATYTIINQGSNNITLGSPDTYPLRLQYNGATDLALGNDGSNAYIDSYFNKDLHINEQTGPVWINGKRPALLQSTNTFTAPSYWANPIFVSTATGGGTAASNLLINTYPTALTGSDNILMGLQAGNAATTANSNVYIGRQAGFKSMVGTSNVMIGYQSGANMQDSLSDANNVFLGQLSAFNSSDTINGTAIGRGASYNNVHGTGFTTIGELACQNTAADTSLNDIICLGASSQLSASNTGAIGSAAHPIFDLYMNSINVGLNTDGYSITFHAQDSSGTNKSGGNLTAQPGLATGTGTPGQFIVNVSSPGANSGSNVMVSTTALTVAYPGPILLNLPHATIQTLVPKAVGQMVGCSDCTAFTFCMSTGPLRGAWSSPVAKTTACL